MTRIALFVGALAPLEPEGQPSGIIKYPVAAPVYLGPEGLAGDAQGDRRVHGGPEKAVHHYAAENYARLAAQFPAAAPALVPGSLGENVSTVGWDEHSVCLGDVFALGAARVQVAQPRSPCWKIDHRFDHKGMARFIAETGITGWYYRVLAEGEVAPGEAFELLERNADPIPLAELWRVWLTHRPDNASLQRLAATPGLTPAWRKKIADRASWLQANPDAPAAAPPAFHVKPGPSSAEAER